LLNLTIIGQRGSEYFPDINRNVVLTLPVG
jgi:hypothetical protein